jgi:hypothetical protein
MRPYMKPRVVPYGIRAYNGAQGLVVRGFICGAYYRAKVMLIDDWLFDKLTETAARI